jgi:hypothetical protein
LVSLLVAREAGFGEAFWGWRAAGVSVAASGAIFDQKRPTKWLVICWAATLALVGPFFGLVMAPGFFLTTLSSRRLQPEV